MGTTPPYRTDKDGGLSTCVSLTPQTAALIGCTFVSDNQHCIVGAISCRLTKWATHAVLELGHEAAARLVVTVRPRWRSLLAHAANRGVGRRRAENIWAVIVPPLLAHARSFGVSFRTARRQ